MDASNNYLNNIDAFKNDFNLILIDLPGHGLSGELDKYTIENYVTTVTKFLYEINVDVDIIIGHSLGSIIASKIVKKINNKVILVGPPKTKSGIWRKGLIFLLRFLNAIRLLPIIIFVLKNSIVFRRFWSKLMISNDTKSLNNKITFDNIKLTKTKAIIDSIFEIFEEKFYIRDEDITDQTCVIVGGNDPVSELDSYDKVESRNRFEVSGSKHAPNRTSAEEFNRIAVEGIKG
ncbi:MAG: alpha/beta hydrolase [Candidatus Dojkabacteria bacterium]|nr:alpha/beta hydrolase [Candidatus Dojkabacteria bacterium]MDQ7020723.1 alpha/beta hydrolase [Candidatus Dojkabacteria bacterium]